MPAGNKNCKIENMETRTSPWQMVVALGILFFAVLTLNNFTHYLARLNALSNQSRRLQAEATQLAYTQSAWQATLTAVASDAAVAEWAHQNGMAAPDEALVVPQPLGQPLPTPTAPIHPTPTPPTWQLWWEVFFGQTPAP